MARDEFSTGTKRRLGEAVGFNCVRPGCGKPTTAYDQNSGRVIHISVSAHDSAASLGGPRYCDNMSTEQRKAADNGAWLCPTCARLVDVDQSRFPLGTISDWQRRAEEYRYQRMQMPVPPTGIDFRQACESAQKFIALCQPIYFDHWNNSISWKSIDAINNLGRTSHPLIATNLVCALFPHLVNIQEQMLDAIHLVASEISTSDIWWLDECRQTYFLTNKSTCLPNHEEQIRNNQIDQFAFVVRARFQDFFNLKEELSSIAYSASPSMDLYSW